MNLSRAAKRAFLSIIAVIALVAGLSFSPNTVNAAVEKTISSAGGSISFTYTTQASITNLSSKPAWLSVSSRLNSSTSVTYTITASANPNCGSRSFDLYFSGTNETYRITQSGLGHSYTVYEKTNPTCSSYGHECFKCFRCNSRTQGNSIPPLAHTYTTEKKAATYTATGYEKTYCKVCGHVQKTTTIAKLKETVTYDPNGGTASVTSRQVTHGGTYGKVDNAKRTGYTFAGWYTAKSGGSRVYETTTVTATGNHTLYAHWTANTYTVSFDSQGGTSVSSRTVTFDSTYGTTTNQLTNPKRTGYTFAGWYTAKSGGTFISFSSKVTTASNHTLYAHWTANKYTVYFDNGTTTTKGTVTYGNTYGTLSAPTKTGYTLDGWYTAKTGGTKITSSTKVTITADQTLYAHWTANTYTVSFDSQGGSSVSDRTVTFGSTYGTTTNQLTNPKRTGYTFAGWYTAKSGGTFISFSSKVTTASNHTLYAHWTANTYTVYFDNGTTKEKGTVTYGNTYGALSAPTKTGYTLDGWYTAINGGTKITSSTKVTITADQTLYAHWTAIEYKVTFDKNGGSGSNITRPIAYGSTYGKVDKPSRTGYTFVGWYSAKTGGYQVTETTVMSIAGEHSVYAHWEANTYTLSFDSQGGSSVLSRTVTFDSPYGTTNNLLPSPTKTGYLFDGWYTATSGGSYISSSSKVTIADDHKLYAHWKKTYTVSYNIGANASGKIESQMKIHGTDLALRSSTPQKDHYTFLGWDVNNKGLNVVYQKGDVYKENKDITLYAVWEANDVSVTLDYGDGRQESKAYKFEGRYTDLPDEPVRSGYTFLGWYKGTNGGTKVSASSLVDNGSAHTLYAHWMHNGVWLNAAGGTYTLKVDFFSPNHKWNYYFIDSKTSTKEGNRPAWIPNSPKRTSDTSNELSFTYTASRNGEERWTLIYAYEVGTARAMVYKFAQRTSYSVHFDVAGNLPSAYIQANPKLAANLIANAVEPEQFKDPQKDLALPSPTIPGFSFEGWKNKTGTEVYKNTYKQDKSVDLVAVWKPYTISFHENGGQWKNGTRPAAQAWKTIEQVISSAPVFDPYHANTVLVIPEGDSYVPTREGYTFFGWNTKADGTGEFFFPKDNMGGFGSELSSNAVLYAAWLPYTVTFHENGGRWKTGSKPTALVGEGSLNIPDSEEYLPEKEGYYFYGWNTKKDGSGEHFFPKDKVQLNKDVDLYADWLLVVNSNDGGYTYKFTGEIKPNEESRIVINMPSEYCGFYKLAIGDDSNIGLSYQISGSKSKTYLVPKSEHPASGYYYMDSESEDIFLVIKNSTGSIQKADVKIVSNIYEINANEIDSNTSVVWKSSASSYFPATWEVYLCPRDIGAYLTAYNLSEGIYLDQQNLANFLKDNSEDILMDIATEAAKKAVSKALGKYSEGAEEIYDYAETIGGLVIDYIGKYHKYMTSRQTAYWWLTSGVGLEDDTVRIELTGDRAGIQGTSIPYNIVKVDYGVHFTIQPNIIGGDPESLVIKSSALLANENLINLWEDRTIKIRPGAIGSFEIYNSETLNVLDNVHMQSAPWSDVSWITAVNTLNQCRVVVPTKGEYYIMDKNECDKQKK